MSEVPLYTKPAVEAKQAAGLPRRGTVCAEVLVYF